MTISAILNLQFFIPVGLADINKVWRLTFIETAGLDFSQSGGPVRAKKTEKP